ARFRGRHLGGGGFGEELLRLPHPVLLLDAPAKGERLIHIGDVVVGEIGDLVELDDAEAVELARQVGAEALDAGQVVRLPLRPLEPLEGGVEALGARVRALEDARRLAAPAAQVIKLGATYLAAADDLN